MARTCTICSHPKREEIDAALVSQVPIRDIAGRTGTKRSAIDRHRKHLAPALMKAEDARQTTRADSLLETIHGLAADAHRIRAKAEDAEDLRTALDAIGKLTKIVELLVKLRAETTEDAQPLRFVVTMADGRISNHREGPEVPVTDYTVSSPTPAAAPAFEEMAPATAAAAPAPPRKRAVRPYVPPPPPDPVAVPPRRPWTSALVPPGGFDF